VAADAQVVDRRGTHLVGILEGLDAVPAERVVLRQGGDRDTVLIERDSVGDRILRRIAPGAEDVAIPLLAGNLIRDRRLDDQDFLVFLGDRQVRKGGGRR